MKRRYLAALCVAVISLPWQHGDAAQDPYHITGTAGFTLGWPLASQPTQGMTRTAGCRDMDSSGVGALMTSDEYIRVMAGDPWVAAGLPITLSVCSYQGMVGAIGIVWSPVTFARARDPELAWRDATIAIAKRLAADYDRSLVTQSRVGEDGTVLFTMRDAQGNGLALSADRAPAGRVTGFRIAVFYFWASVLSR